MTLTEVFTDEPTVSRSEALGEVSRHGIEVSEFLTEFGDVEEYNSRRILEWLGY